jgi:hypothetical protein
LQQEIWPQAISLVDQSRESMQGGATVQGSHEPISSSQFLVHPRELLPANLRNQSQQEAAAVCMINQYQQIDFIASSWSLPSRWQINSAQWRLRSQAVRYTVETRPTCKQEKQNQI